MEKKTLQSLVNERVEYLKVSITTTINSDTIAEAI